MNERIRELKIQASLWCDDNIADQYSEETNSYSAAWEDKFAELIVRECVGVVDDMADPEDSDRYFWAIQNASQKIKKHFGVEE